MRIYTYKLFTPVFAILLGFCITSCQTDELTEREEVQLQVLVAGEKPQSRVSVDGTKFENDDKFRFFFDTAIPSDDSSVKTAMYTYSDATWTPSPTPIYWDDQVIKQRSFCAFLPYDASNLNNATAYSFSVKANQLGEADYKDSDLLIARVETAKRLIPLNFWHVLSKVVVNITASTDDSKGGYFGANDLDGMKVELMDIEPDATATYGTLTAEDATYDPKVTTTAGGTATDIQMLCTKAPENNTTNKKITATYTAVIPPQTVLADTRVLRLTLNIGGIAKQYYLKHNVAIEFPQSKELTINIGLYKNEVELSTTADDIKIQPWGSISAEDDNPIVLPK